MIDFLITGIAGFTIIAIGCIGLFCIIALLAIALLSEYNWKIRSLCAIISIISMIVLCGSLGYINKEDIKYQNNQTCKCPCSQQKEI